MRRRRGRRSIRPALVGGLVLAWKCVRHGVERYRCGAETELVGVAVRIVDEHAKDLDRGRVGLRAGGQQRSAVAIRERRVFEYGAHETPTLANITTGRRVDLITLDMHPALQNLAGVQQLTSGLGPRLRSACKNKPWGQPISSEAAHFPPPKERRETGLARYNPSETRR
jgi:hypothetical protein